MSICAFNLTGKKQSGVFYFESTKQEQVSTPVCLCREAANVRLQALPVAPDDRSSCVRKVNRDYKTIQTNVGDGRGARGCPGVFLGVSGGEARLTARARRPSLCVSLWTSSCSSFLSVIGAGGSSPSCVSRPDGFFNMPPRWFRS